MYIMPPLTRLKRRAAVAAVAAAATIPLAFLSSCARFGSAFTQYQGYAAAGEVHPQGHSDWCLSVTALDPQPGDRVFIAECGEKGTHQQWDATRVSMRGGEVGVIQLFGTQLAISSKGSDVATLVLPGGSGPRSFSMVYTLIFIPREQDGTTFWEVQNPARSYRPMTTAGTLKGGWRYTVFWHTQRNVLWQFPPWHSVPVEEETSTAPSPSSPSQRTLPVVGMKLTRRRYRGCHRRYWLDRLMYAIPEPRSTLSSVPAIFIILSPCVLVLLVTGIVMLVRLLS